MIDRGSRGAIGRYIRQGVRNQNRRFSRQQVTGLSVEKANNKIEDHSQNDRKQDGRDQGNDAGQVVGLNADISRQLEEIDPQSGSQVNQSADKKQNDAGDHQQPGDWF